MGWFTCSRSAAIIIHFNLQLTLLHSCIALGEQDKPLPTW